MSEKITPKTKLKQYYEAAGFDCGKKDYIDNCEIREILKPIIRLLMIKKLEAEAQNMGEAEYNYRTLYLDIWFDLGLSFVDMSDMFALAEKEVKQSNCVDKTEASK